MRNLNEYRAEKEGIVTPRNIAERLLKEIEAGNVKSCIVIYTTQDDEVRSGYSDQTYSSIIGLLEWIKFDLLANGQLG